MSKALTSIWTPAMVARLTKMYPEYGLAWCVENMGLTSAQVRAKASRLGLKARGVSEAWKKAQAERGETLKGRKRPEQSEVMKRLHAEGKLVQSDEIRAAQQERMKEWRRTNPHPRGALGHKHSDATKAVIGEKSVAAWAAKTPEQQAEKTRKMLESKVANGTYALPRTGTTWKAGWREIGGVRKYYRSKWEANYAHYLQWLKEKGEILSWSHEPKTFWFEGIKRGTMSYLPDFCVTELSGAESYHEVKGWMDDRSKTKIKRMAKYHPDVKLIVIDSKAYAALKKTASRIVPGWEE